MNRTTMQHTRQLDQDVFYCPPGTRHYNICFKGGALLSRVAVRSFERWRHQDIDWVWIIEERRRATPEEIRNLCSGRAGRL
jgi:5-methylcytosine-specific restriction endonuclease McrA